MTATLFFSVIAKFLLGTALTAFLCYPAILIRRIRSEEAILEAGLPGYRDYEKKVTYRLLPFVW